MVLILNHHLVISRKWNKNMSISFRFLFSIPDFLRHLSWFILICQKYQITQKKKTKNKKQKKEKKTKKERRQRFLALRIPFSFSLTMHFYRVKKHGKFFFLWDKKKLSKREKEGWEEKKKKTRRARERERQREKVAWNVIRQ